jgi:Bacterial SH3 domain
MKSKASSMAVVALTAASVLAQDTTTVKVEFAPRTDRRKFEDRIEGNESFDYIVPAEAGERLKILYTSDNMGTYINLYPPGSDTAMYVGANLGNRFEGTLADTGDYRVHVYMMPNAAHRGEIADFTIELTLDRGTGFADGLGGGPDFWVVNSVSESETMIIRAGPSTSRDVVSRVANGMRLRNLGCKIEGGSRWCRVRTSGDASVEGWADGRYLTEAAGPGASGGTKVRPSDEPNAPELSVRSSGELEVSFKSGCGTLFDADGSRITAGGSCSAEQLRQAAETVEGYRRQR